MNKTFNCKSKLNFRKIRFLFIDPFKLRAIQKILPLQDKMFTKCLSVYDKSLAEACLDFIYLFSVTYYDKLLHNTYLLSFYNIMNMHKYISVGIYLDF